MVSQSLKLVPQTDLSYVQLCQYIYIYIYISNFGNTTFSCDELLHTSSIAKQTVLAGEIVYCCQNAYGKSRPQDWTQRCATLVGTSVQVISGILTILTGSKSCLSPKHRFPSASFVAVLGVVKHSWCRSQLPAIPTLVTDSGVDMVHSKWGWEPHAAQVIRTRHHPRRSLAWENQNKP